MTTKEAEEDDEEKDEEDEEDDDEDGRRERREGAKNKLEAERRLERKAESRGADTAQKSISPPKGIPAQPDQSSSRMKPRVDQTLRRPEGKHRTVATTFIWTGGARHQCRRQDVTLSL